MTIARQYQKRIPGIRRAAAAAALFLTTLCVLALIATQPAQAQTYSFKTIYSFTGANASDGAAPYGGLVVDALGNLYGTTTLGGSNASACHPVKGPAGCGTVFEISPSGGGSWTESVLYRFTSDSTINGNTGTTCYDGAIPYGGVALGANGNLFGTTSVGGVNGLGTVFEVLQPSSTNPLPPVQDQPCFSSNGLWTEVPLHSFDGNASGNGDGANPEGGLVLDRLGNLYGTDYNTIFKVDPIGRLTTLYNFSLNPYDSQGNANGTNPGSVLVLSGSNLFGTTLSGGNNGMGTAFELAKYSNVADAVETGILQFGYGDQFGIQDGAEPFSGLAGTASALYGTTFEGGNGFGTVYKTTSLGVETVLYSFNGQADGGGPVGGIVRDKKGNIYGTTSSGGAYGFGTVFKVSPVSVINDVYNETTLYSFTGGADGGGPTAGLVFDAQGDLYGTTYSGGVNTGGCGAIYGCGTVFELQLLPATTTTLVSSAEPAIVGETVNFTATITPAPPDGELVSFTVATYSTRTTVVSGSQALAGGSATFSTSAIPVGSYLVTATYPGDSNLAPSTGKVVQLVKR